MHVFDVTISLQVGVIGGEGMTDTPPSDGPSQGAEFDMMGALDWKDGIATLPGSDIRVRERFGSRVVPDCVHVLRRSSRSHTES